MKRRIFVSTIVASLGAVTLFAPSSSAENGNADCRNLPGERATSGWTSYEELGKRLAQIEATSHGRVSVDVIGKSHRGRDIYAARVGTGDRVLLITSEIHGNEKTGPEAVLQMLKTLGSSGSPQAKAIRDNLTIVAVPKFNPDGAELNRRQNDFPWSEVVEKFPQLAGTNPPYYYSNGAQGFDINRDFSADLTAEPSPETRPTNETLPGMYLTNESRALRDLYVNLRDEFGKVHAYVDLHHMGPCNQNNDTEQYVTVSLDFPPLGSEVDGNPRYADWPLLDQDASRRHALAAALGMIDHGGNGSGTNSPFVGGVSRYVHYQVADGYSYDRDYAGQARSAFALNGTASVLFEVRGQSHAWGQKQNGMLTQVVQAGLFGIADRMADRSVDNLNGNHFYDLPKYW
ncbi:M14 family zinc carboxypeptidase [Verrucosispora sp. ts21]|uniref:M14 family zinc carboxypeptidase n=1 Tax=Verrucosispora sp. ts21 TaxID=2069341 RepID=UPI0018EA6776|nr:M14 family zinc carboxypeptidase [Verrucosispora sp. ts21]